MRTPYKIENSEFWYNVKKQNLWCFLQNLIFYSFYCFIDFINFYCFINFIDFIDVIDFYRFCCFTVFTILPFSWSWPSAWVVQNPDPPPLPPIFFNKPHNDKTARPLGKNLRSWAVVKTHPPCGFSGGGVPRFRGGPGGWFWGVRKFGGRYRIWGGGYPKSAFWGRSDNFDWPG